ncbi:hypothetical protein QR685DRAFT_574466 [Neurospora intermedia]|uniref:Uncharacterized protein n=1 Tax=Neurospora intermedia TaxID=5142 RepID=A0ABR3D4P4_NEUIN
MIDPQVFDLQLKKLAKSMWEHADKQTKHQQASSSRSLVNAAISSPKKTCQKGHLPLQCLPRQPLTTRVRPPKRP